MIIAAKVLAGAAVLGLLATAVSTVPEASQKDPAQRTEVATASSQPADEVNERQFEAALPAIPSSVQYCPNACDWAALFQRR